MIKLGDKITVEKVFSPEEVVAYCKFMDCAAPVHVSTEASRAYGFEDMVVPGQLSVTYALSSKELDYMDNLCIIAGCSYTAVRPIYVDRKYIYHYRCISFDKATGDCVLKISVKDGANRIYLVCKCELIYTKK